MAGLFRRPRVVWCTDPGDVGNPYDAAGRVDRFLKAVPRYRRWPWLLPVVDTGRSAVFSALSTAAYAWLAVSVVYTVLSFVSVVPPVGRALDGLAVWTETHLPAGWVGLVGVVLLVAFGYGVVRGVRRAGEQGDARRLRWVRPVDGDLERTVRQAARWFRHGPGDAGEQTLPAPDGPSTAALLWWLQGWMSRPVALGTLAAAAREERLTARSERSPVGRWRRRVVAAHEAAAAVHWEPYQRLVLLLEPPREVRDLPDRPGHRLVVWSGGQEWWLRDGVRLPRSPDAGPWTVAEIHSMTNTEVRRVMIESIGWPAYVREAGLALVATAPDPANAPHELRLYEPLPTDRWRGRLLLMTNGSPNREGGLRHFAEYVPGDLDDPVEAAAWQYGVPVPVYRGLQRRT